MKNKGFTLIEILVLVAIFSVVMVIALGALLAMSVSDRKAESIKSVADNLSFAVDSMSRALRTGTGYHCGSAGGQDCPSGSNILYFTSASGVQTAYQFATPGTCANAVGCIQRSVFSGGWGAWQDLTAPDVIVTNGTFYVRGSLPGSADDMQPIVTVTLAGYAQVSATEQSAFHLQTSVTQRIYDQ